MSAAASEIRGIRDGCLPADKRIVARSEKEGDRKVGAEHIPGSLVARRLRSERGRGRSLVGGTI